MIENIALRIVKLQIKKPWYFLLVFFIITLLMVPGLMKLPSLVEPSLEKVLPQDVLEVKLMNSMRAKFGADMMYILLESEYPFYDVRSPEAMVYMNLLGAKLRERHSILEVWSPVDFVLESQGVIPDSLDEVKTVLVNSPANELMDEDYSFAVMQIRSDTGADAKTIKKVVEDIKEDIVSVESFNPGLNAKLTGFNVIDKATFEVIISDFIVITILSLVLVSIVVLLTFRSVAKGMMPMIVVMVALLWMMGIVGYIGMTITVVSMVAAAMIMGLGIDFGIHVVHSFYENRKKMSSKHAITETMSELLRAMLGASLTTIAGFLALLFGVLPAMKNLGIILAIGIFSTLMGAVFLLPSIIYLYDTRWTK